MSSASRRLEVHRKPSEDPADAPKPERDESLRDCRLCKSEHALRKCPKFRKMSVGERWKTVKRFQYCFNCLAHSHMRDKCTSRERCMECRAEHHTLLHRHKGTKSGPRAGGNPGSAVAVKTNRRRRQKTKTKSSRIQQHQCCHHHAPQQLPQRQSTGSNSQAATIVINVMSGRVA